MLFSEIVDAIKNELQAYFLLGGITEDKQGSLTNAMAEGYVNEALVDLSAMGCINERRDLSTATYDSTLNQSSLILPTDLASIANVSYLVSGKLKPLTLINNDLSMESAVTGTTPTAYYVLDEMSGAGVPQKRLVITGNTGTYHIVADVYVIHPKMQITDTNQIMRIPVQYHISILNYAKSRALDLAASCMTDPQKSATALQLSSKTLQLYLADKKKLHADALWYGKNDFVMRQQ